MPLQFRAIASCYIATLEHPLKFRQVHLVTLSNNSDEQLLLHKNKLDIEFNIHLYV